MAALEERHERRLAEDAYLVLRVSLDTLDHPVGAHALPV